jgi:hypothetical protein
MLLVLSAAAIVLTLGTAPLATGAEQHWAGTTSTSNGSTNLEFEVVTAPRRKGGRKKTTPIRVHEWIMGSSLTCTGANAVGNSVSDGQYVPGVVGSSFPGVAKSTGSLRVRNGRFSDAGTYDVVDHGTPKHITYEMSGRFTSRRSATGTLHVNTVRTYPEGLQNCDSGPRTWNACTWKSGRPACAGTDESNSF